MKRLIIVCEGQTEQEFCQEVLATSLLSKEIYVEAPTIHQTNGGIVAWNILKRQLERHLKEGNAIVSMLVDYYGITDEHCFPGWNESKEIADKVDRMHFLFEKIAEDMPEKLRYKFIPYIQLHEFEGLLFSDVDAFKLTFDEKNIDFEKIRSAADSFENPELINNSPLTAPSKRLIAAIPGYNKVIDGNCVAMDIGLNKIRLKCPLFNEWVEKLENI
jgi:hypothetical protein